jgi:membrane associated rhomboid family serine protease
MGVAAGMGFLDREYYRDEERGPWAAWFREGLVTKSLFALHGLICLIQISFQTRPGTAVSGVVAETLALQADKVWAGEVWRLLTYVFVQPAAPNLFPILWNFALLWVAGHELEQRLGRQRFLAFYLLTSVISGLAMMAALLSGINGVHRATTWAFGCTAPVTGIVALLTWQSPRKTLTFFTALHVPTWLLLALSVLSDVVGAFWPALPVSDGRRVTLAAHAGALMTASTAYALLRWLPGWTSRRPLIRSRPSVTIYREEEGSDEVIPAPVPSHGSPIDEHLEAQLDAILAKVAAHGQQSLTRAEMDILKKASEVYRKRRR